MRLGQFKSGGEFKLVPEGSQVGTVTGVVYLGLQPGSIQFPKPAHKLALIISFPGEFTDDESRNLSITSTYTASSHKKSALRKVVEAVNGAAFKSDKDAEAFDPETLIGRSALWQVVHKTNGDKTFANIGGVIALPKGMPVPQTINETIVFTPDLEGDAFVTALNKLPEWLRKKWEDRIPDENAAGGDDVPV